MATQPYPRADWVGLLPQDVLVSRLTLPGTHDSGTSTVKSDTMGAQTQNLGLVAQLRGGVRCLDIRLAPPYAILPPFRTSGLEIFHGLMPCGTMAEGVFAEVRDFLVEHPSEFVIMIIKPEEEQILGIGGMADLEFSEALQVALKVIPEDMLYKGGFTQMPTVADLKGKLAILKRWYDPCGIYGAAIPPWPDDDSQSVPADASRGDAVNIVVQDEYKLTTVSSPADKYARVQEAFEDAAKPSADKSRTLYFNFTNVEHTPRAYAGGGPNEPGVNWRVLQYLQSHPNPAGGYGMVYMDFIDHPQDQLCIQALIDCNAQYIGEAS